LLCEVPFEARRDLGEFAVVDPFGVLARRIDHPVEKHQIHRRFDHEFGAVDAKTKVDVRAILRMSFGNHGERCAFSRRGIRRRGKNSSRARHC
jgi:hypothetical protein